MYKYGVKGIVCGELKGVHNARMRPCANESLAVTAELLKVFTIPENLRGNSRWRQFGPW